MIKINKKILILHSSNDLYGASKIFLQIIHVLCEQEHEVHVFLPEKGKLDKLLNSNVIINHFELGVLRKNYFNPLGIINRLSSNIKAVNFLSNYIKLFSIDVVYTNTSTILCGGIAARINKIPSLFHIHEIPYGSKIYKFFIGKIINMFSDKIITVSKSVKKYWIKDLSNLKISTIYNGIELNENLNKNLNKNFTLINVGRIYPLKGHMYFIEIILELLKIDSNLRFNIYGTPLDSGKEYFDKIKKIIIDNDLVDIVSFKGFIDNKYSIYQNSDMLVHTSIYPDSLPTVILESLSYNVPVVSTDIGGSSEILNNGNLGLLIPLNRPFDSANLIYKYINNKALQRKHKNNSREFLHNNFSIEVFKIKIIKELNNLF